MPKGPQGQKRPPDVIGNAVHIMRIATGEEEDPKNVEAVERGRKGGNARASKRLRTPSGDTCFNSVALGILSRPFRSRLSTHRRENRPALGQSPNSHEIFLNDGESVTRIR
jgi:hypothetical protein